MSGVKVTRHYLIKYQYKKWVSSINVSFGPYYKAHKFDHIQTDEEAQTYFLEFKKENEEAMKDSREKRSEEEYFDYTLERVDTSEETTLISQ